MNCVVSPPRNGAYGLTAETCSSTARYLDRLFDNTCRISIIYCYSQRNHLHARKQKSGGDVLAWMFKRPKVSVKYQENGKETIVDKAIYKMILIGDEDEESSGVEEELRLRKR